MELEQNMSTHASFEDKQHVFTRKQRVGVYTPGQEAAELLPRVRRRPDRDALPPVIRLPPDNNNNSANVEAAQEHSTTAAELTADGGGHRKARRPTCC